MSVSKPPDRSVISRVSDDVASVSLHPDDRPALIRRQDSDRQRGAHSSGRPAASVSVDLDNLWAYLRASGRGASDSLPSYFDLIVPRMLEFFAKRQITATFFIVGQDASIPDHAAALASIARAGHEIASHSFAHDPQMADWDEEAMHADLSRAEVAIEEATGHKPRGFRGPGFSTSARLDRVLGERRYLYDASRLPTSIAPLARAYFRARSTLNKSERRSTGRLYGSLRQAFQPNRPYRLPLDNSPLWEVPVSTMPLVRTPIHMTYVMYLARFSPRVARSYFRWAVRLHRWRREGLSLLLHPTDFLSAAEIPDMAYFPGMNLPTSTKLAVLGDALDALASAFAPGTIRRQIEWRQRAESSLTTTGTH